MRDQKKGVGRGGVKKKGAGREGERGVGREIRN